MFDRLTSSFSTALNALTGRGHLTDENIADTVRQVRLALLDADVALPVVKNFTDAIKARAVGVEIAKSLTPGQAFIKVVHEELVRLMGEASGGLNLRAQRPVVVMLAGLQGAGKTTTAGKLARWLIEKQRKKVLMVSTDVYRPAAILQLQTLAAQVGAGFAAGDASEAPVTLARGAPTAPPCRSGRGRASPFCSSAPAKSRRRSNCSIRSASPHAFWAWATCCRWSS